MDDNMNQWAESGPCIWLRYATQYTKDGQTHTVEMSVPIPIGASVEMRERLISEAEAGMGQLVNRVERRGNQSSQRAQSVPTTQGMPAAQGSQTTHATQRLAPPPAANTRPAPRPAVRPANVPAPQTVPLPAIMRDHEHEREATGRGSERQNTVVGTTGVPSAPRAPGRGGEMGGNMQLPHFIQYIKENMDLTPKQAMELLNVRSLSTGINLREAIEQLKVLSGRDIPGTNGVSGQDNRDTQDAEYTSFPSEDNEPEYDVIPMSRASRSSAPIIEMRVGRPSPTFDEEVGPDDEPDAEVFDDLEDLEPSHELSALAIERANAKLDELRESQGAATANAGRLQALNNVAISQVTEEQLQELVNGVWGISSLKKLKVDQVEALISWAKLEDDFAEQVEAVLVVLEEDRYARGNR